MKLVQHRQAGIAVVTVLMVLSVLALLVVAIMSQSTGGLNGQQRGTQDLKALYAAEAGAWRAVSEVAEKGTVGVLWTDQGMETAPAVYSAEVWQGPGSQEGLTIPDGQHYLIKATGKSSLEPGASVKNVVALVRRGPTGSFDTAVFAEESLLIDDAATRPWNGDDSTLNSALNPNINSLAPPSAGQAHIGVNNVTGGSVVLSGTATVGTEGAGQVIVGPGGDDSVVAADPTAQYSGTYALAEPRTLDPVTLPLASVSTDLTVTGTQVLSGDAAYKDVDVNGGELKLNPGSTYQFASLTLRNGGKLTLNTQNDSDPGVEVFVEGSVRIANGSIVNPTQEPAKFRLMLAGDSDVDRSSVEIATMPELPFFVAYGPLARINVTDGVKLIGAVIGKDVTIDNNSVVVYDTRLAAEGILGSMGGGGSFGVDVVLFQRR
jgi:hypothetical protein